MGTWFNKHYFQKPKSHKIPFYVIKSRREKSKLHKFMMGIFVILSLSFFHLRYVSLILKRSKIVSVSLIMERRKYIYFLFWWKWATKCTDIDKIWSQVLCITPRGYIYILFGSKWAVKHNNRDMIQSQVSRTTLRGNHGYHTYIRITNLHLITLTLPPLIIYDH